MAGSSPLIFGLDSCAVRAVAHSSRPARADGPRRRGCAAPAVMEKLVTSPGGSIALSAMFFNGLAQQIQVPVPTWSRFTGALEPQRTVGRTNVSRRRDDVAKATFRRSATAMPSASGRRSLEAARSPVCESACGRRPASGRSLARSAGCAERYVREWLNAQAAAGYVVYYPMGATYELTSEQAMVLADEDSPVFIPPAWNVPASMGFDEDKTLEAFRTGRGVAWGEHDARMSCGVAAFYRNGYRASLVPQWLPALDGVYGLICFFDCLHDLGDPEAAARHAAKVLAPGGTVMLVEPFAHDRNRTSKRAADAPADLRVRRSIVEHPASCYRCRKRFASFSPATRSMGRVQAGLQVRYSTRTVRLRSSSAGTGGRAAAAAR